MGISYQTRQRRLLRNDTFRYTPNGNYMTVLDEEGLCARQFLREHRDGRRRVDSLLCVNRSLKTLQAGMDQAEYILRLCKRKRPTVMYTHSQLCDVHLNHYLDFAYLDLCGMFDRPTAKWFADTLIPHMRAQSEIAVTLCRTIRNSKFQSKVWSFFAESKYSDLVLDYCNDLVTNTSGLTGRIKGCTANSLHVAGAVTPAALKQLGMLVLLMYPAPVTVQHLILYHGVTNERHGHQMSSIRLGIDKTAKPHWPYNFHRAVKDARRRWLGQRTVAIVATRSKHAEPVFS